MGCASSSHAVTDQNGKTTTKHKMGGAYPGNRRTPQQAYTPGASDFNANGQATAHFVAYGGGNALVLKPQTGVAQPIYGGAGQKTPEFIQVTLPAGVHAGQKIHVQARDGRLNEIIVPDGFGPGSTFTVEFADKAPAPTTYNAAPQTTAMPTTQQYAPSMAAATTVNNNDHDDGFATGFGNPNFVPSPAPAAPMATAHAHAEPLTTTSNFQYNTTPYVTTNTNAKPIYANPY